MFRQGWTVREGEFSLTIIRQGYFPDGPNCQGRSCVTVHGQPVRKYFLSGMEPSGLVLNFPCRLWIRQEIFEHSPPGIKPSGKAFLPCRLSKPSGKAFSTHDGVALTGINSPPNTAYPRH